MRLGRLRALHLMGIGGAGMCALAELGLASGLEISGCDLEASPRTERLVELGARVFLGHAPWHVETVDAVAASAAVPAGDPELAAARERGIPVVSRGELLAEAMRGRYGLAVAGTHGKTSTAAMVTFLLREAGLDPAAVLGGRPLFLDGHAATGDGPVLVAEADEYARTFLALDPVWAVLTNVEAEHLDVYGSEAALVEAFAEFASRVPFWGRVIACADDPGAMEAARRAGRPLLTYGFAPKADLRPEALESVEGGWRFAVTLGGRPLLEARLPLPGRHNVANALAAVAAALEAGADVREVAGALGRFPGVERRLERLGERAGVLVIDDYAHHPTEIAATLEAVRRAWAGRRIVAVFEPHLYSRTQAFAGAFGRALAGAGRLVLLPVYPARETPVAGVDSGLVAAAVRAADGPEPVMARGYDEAVAALESELRSGDLLLTLGAGPVRAVGERWLGGDA